MKINIAFDYGKALEDHEQLVGLAASAAKSGKVHLICAISDTEHEPDIRDECKKMPFKFASLNFLLFDLNKVRPGGVEEFEIGKRKAAVMKKVGATILVDDNPYICAAVREAGLIALKISDASCKPIDSETAKHRHSVAKYCVGNGCDVASGGDPVVPWAISLDLPESDYARYNSGESPRGPIQWRGNAIDLPFKDRTLGFIYISHLLEDYFDWHPPLREWCRVVKIGGHIVILIPDKERWNNAIRHGQPANCSHKHEGRVHELTEVFSAHFRDFEVVEDRLSDLTTPMGVPDYTIIFAAKRLR